MRLAEFASRERLYIYTDAGGSMKRAGIHSLCGTERSYCLDGQQQNLHCTRRRRGRERESAQDTQNTHFHPLRIFFVIAVHNNNNLYSPYLQLFNSHICGQSVRPSPLRGAAGSQGANEIVISLHQSLVNRKDWAMCV